MTDKLPILRLDQRGKDVYVVIGCPDCGTENEYPRRGVGVGTVLHCSGCDSAFYPSAYDLSAAQDILDEAN